MSRRIGVLRCAKTENSSISGERFRPASTRNIKTDYSSVIEAVWGPALEGGRGEVSALIAFDAGLVACFTSLLFGIVAGYHGTEVTCYVDVHGGLITPLAIPWRNALLGFCLAFGVCAVAATALALVVG